MKFSLRPYKRAGLACVALGAIAMSQQALADGTEASTAILNRATVNYQVGGVAQNPIESSPTGNSTAGVGAGADTSFVVDNKIDLTVTEVGGGATTVSAGAVNVYTTFRVTNEGNFAQGYNLTAVNEQGTTLFGRTDAAGPTGVEMGNVRTFVSAAPCGGANPVPTYDSGADTATNVASLDPETCAYVFIVADTPVTATNGQVANVNLTALARVASTLAALTETAGAETPGTVDIVFADAGRNASEAASDQYWLQTAAMSVAKTSTVVSDPVNGAAGPGVFPKAIPGAVMEYGITLTNTGTADAAVVTITDLIPANTTFANATYAGGTNVSVSVGATNSFCTAEAGGTDSNADGCVIVGGFLNVGAPAVSSVLQGAANAVAVRFRVTIN
jgi:uncharacterized repeat protein (TIGR01451 family)